MATYKVIQDIEAEDKLIGPLTLRQSIYAGIAALFGYLSFVVLTHGLTLMLIIFLPPTLFAAFFAFPWGSDQTTEIWALAKIRFYLKSRRRLWDQTGAKELVTITAPKHEVKHRTNGLSEHEVQNRLNALASTLDSRGWAVKNVYSVSPLSAQADADTDRLIGFGDLPQEVEPTGLSAEDDILDDNNAHAHQLQEMVTAASASHKQALLEHMQHGDLPSLPTPVGAPMAAPQWFTANPVSLPTAPEVAPVTTADEAALSEALHKRHRTNVADSHLKTIRPLSAAAQVPAPPTSSAPVQPAAPPEPPAQTPVTATPDPATIHLSQRDDLNIATIARIAKGEDANEVVISLH